MLTGSCKCATLQHLAVTHRSVAVVAKLYDKLLLNAIAFTVNFSDVCVVL